LGCIKVTWKDRKGINFVKAEVKRRKENEGLSKRERKAAFRAPSKMKCCASRPIMDKYVYFCRKTKIHLCNSN
jgi:hypothetical protein